MPTQEQNIAYYRRRIAACAEQAARAACPSTRRAHEELVRLYQEKVDTFVGEQSLESEPIAMAATTMSDTMSDIVASAAVPNPVESNADGI